MIWILYLISSIVLIRWNPHAGLGFIGHLLLMQGIKYFALPNEQIWFLACHTTSAVLVALFLDKVAGGFLAMIGVVYFAYIAGVSGQGFKLFAAEMIFILGLIVGGVSGPTGTLFKFGNTLPAARLADLIESCAPFNKMPR